MGIIEQTVTYWSLGVFWARGLRVRWLGVGHGGEAWGGGD